MISHIIKKLSRKYGFNEIYGTEDMAHQICEDEGIVIKENQEFTAYLVIDGKPYIALKKGLRGLQKLKALFHEIGHHFLHVGDNPNLVLFYQECNGIKSNNEAEADAFAVVAIVPSIALKNYEFLENNLIPLAKQLYDDRKKLKFLYGIN